MAGEDESMLLGVVGDDSSTVETVAGGADETVAGTARTVLAASPDAVVAVGEAGLLSLARERPDVPILPVDAGAGVRSIPAGRVEEALTRVRTGTWTTEHHPLISVEVDDTQNAVALFDAMTVTAEPAHISEFTLTAGDDQVATFRADGIVIATPAGTSGYARAAGAPVIPPGPDVLAVAPVAPFATTLDHWVVPNDDVTVTVERDDATVDVLADDRTIGIADMDEPINICADGTIETIRLPEGTSPFAPPGTELEKL